MHTQRIWVVDNINNNCRQLQPTSNQCNSRNTLLPCLRACKHTMQHLVGAAPGYTTTSTMCSM
jgi:hypothetical protein